MPSYALGNLYGAQFYHQMKKDIPNVTEQIEAGDLTEIFNWLKTNVHEQGNLYTPAELVNVDRGTIESTIFPKIIEMKNYSRIYISKLIN